MLGVVNEKIKFGEFNTHRAHRSQEKQRKAMRKLLDKYEQMGGGKGNRKTRRRHNVTSKGSCGRS